MCRKKTNKRIVTVFNMIVAIIISVLFGFLLQIIGIPTIIVAGFVSVISVITEHFLTLYPLFIIKYITLPIKEEE